MVGRMMRFGMAALMLLALTGVATPRAATAAQSDECAGLDAYMTEMADIRAQLLTTMGDMEDEDLSTWASERFTAIATSIAETIQSLDAMEVPPVAVAFHQALIAQLELSAQMFTTMATAGIFGALVYVEQMDSLTEATDAAAATISTTCNIDFSGEMGLDDPESGDSPGVGTVDADEPGTRENPIPVGQTAALGEDWELTVLSVEPDATAAVMAESTFNDPPAPGHQFFMATVRVTYVGASSDEFYGGSLRVVGQSAVAYDSWDDYCGSIPNELADRELFTGGTIEGNLCWSVATADVDSLVLYDSYQYSDERVFFSLVPGAGGDGVVASPTATEAAGESGGFRGVVSSAVAQFGGAEDGQASALSVTDTGFDPAELTVAAADLPVTVAVRNDGSTAHTFTIVELDIDVTIAPGATATVTIPAGTAPGDYSFESAPDGSTEDGLVGTLTIE